MPNRDAPSQRRWPAPMSQSPVRWHYAAMSGMGCAAAAMALAPLHSEMLRTWLCRIGDLSSANHECHHPIRSARAPLRLGHMVGIQGCKWHTQEGEPARSQRALGENRHLRGSRCASSHSQSNRRDEGRPARRRTPECRGPAPSSARRTRILAVANKLVWTHKVATLTSSRGVWCAAASNATRKRPLVPAPAVSSRCVC